MSTPTHKGLPIPSGKCSYFGLPYHGLVRAGVMTLPNGSTRANSQPISGSTVMVSNPNKAGLPATRPLASYDAAQGFTWLTYAILAGSTKQIAGIELGEFAFIYVDHRNRPWLMQLGATVGGDWELRVLRRFGLFGDDAVSWIENQVIYTGDFDQAVVMTETLLPDDLCQNADGSSVFLNLRTTVAPPGIIPDLTRIVEINITTADVVPGMDSNLTFNVGFSDYVAMDDVISTGSTTWGPADPVGGGCDSRVVMTVDYNSDDKPPAYCGDSAYQPGVYSTSGSVSTNSNWTDGSNQRGGHDWQRQVVKAYYGHDGVAHLIEMRYDSEWSTTTVQSCNSALSCTLQETITVPDRGDDDGGGYPCSSAGTIQYTEEIVSTVNYSNNQVAVRDYYGGLYIDGVQRIGWQGRTETTANTWSTIDGNYSYSDSYTEGTSYVYPTEHWTIVNMCTTWQPGQIKTVFGDQTVGSGSTTTSSTTIEGLVFSDPNDAPIEFKLNEQYVREYANNIHSLVLISQQYSEGDPGAPEWFGQYGLVAEGQKALSGKLASSSFKATINPVDGAVTVDAVDAVCYA